VVSDDDDVIEIEIVFDHGDVPALPQFDAEFLLWFHPLPATW
jgi:hypothetical protein